MLYDFTRQGRASEWERVKPNRWTSICGGTNCCVPQCSHNSLKNPNLSFYKIPKDGPKEFIEIIYIYVESIYFDNDWWERTMVPELTSFYFNYFLLYLKSCWNHLLFKYYLENILDKTQIHKLGLLVYILHIKGPQNVTAVEYFQVLLWVYPFM